MRSWIARLRVVFAISILLPATGAFAVSVAQIDVGSAFCWNTGENQTGAGPFDLSCENDVASASFSTTGFSMPTLAISAGTTGLGTHAGTFAESLVNYELFFSLVAADDTPFIPQLVPVNFHVTGEFQTSGDSNLYMAAFAQDSTTVFHGAAVEEQDTVIDEMFSINMHLGFEHAMMFVGKRLVVVLYMRTASL